MTNAIAGLALLAGAANAPVTTRAKAGVELIIDKLDTWGRSAIAALPNLILAVVVALIFWTIARLMRSGTDRALNRTSMPDPIRRILVGAVGFSINIAGIFIGLGILGLDKTVTSLLAGVGIAGLALGFAFQNIASNFMAGVILAFRRPYRTGDLVETNDVLGVVYDMNLRVTIIRKLTGEIVRVPNQKVIEGVLTNYTESGERRIDLPVGVSYGSDLEKVRRITVEAVSEVEGRNAERPVDLFFDEFGDSSINFVVRFWIDTTKQVDYLGARSDAVMRIRKAYHLNDITIPFPIRTLDFGIIGGEKLDETLARTSLGGAQPE
ncbi:MAG: mechanosensitive ion channel family protein [Thermoanaerobaculia bacterium]